jgi:transposase-like protein
VEGALPRRVITDQLGSYGVAMQKLMPGVQHINRQGNENEDETDVDRRDRRDDSFRVFQRLTTTSEIAVIH